MKTTCFIQTHPTLTRSSRSISIRRRGRRFLLPGKLPAVLLAAMMGAAVTTAWASDPIGVFAKIDKVVLEPDENSPERIQVLGSFCVADPKDRDSYSAPQKGYLYYKLPEAKAEAARKEWNDLKAVAGSGDVIGFGSRFATLPKVRAAKDKPENPDVYSVGFGLVKARQRGVSYPPIKALQASAEGKASQPKEKSK
jgi:hypothetical protein